MMDSLLAAWVSERDSPQIQKDKLRKKQGLILVWNLSGENLLRAKQPDHHEARLR